MFDELYAALNDYSDAPEWTPEGVSADTVVIYQTVYWRSKTDTLTVPSIGEDWELAPKFSSDCMNSIWCKELGPYLAWLVIRQTVPAVNVSLTGQGIVRKFGEGFSAAETTEVKRYQVLIDKNIEMYFSLLMYKLSTVECLTYSRNCAKCGCSTTQCRCNKKHHQYEVA